MREVTKFQANDGTLFDTPEECDEYEHNVVLANFLASWCNSIASGPDYYINLAQRIRTAFTVTPVGDES